MPPPVSRNCEECGRVYMYGWVNEYYEWYNWFYCAGCCPAVWERNQAKQRGVGMSEEVLVKCAKCDKLAEYDSPDRLCEDHWVEWWVDGLEPKDEAERQQLIADIKENIHTPLSSDEAIEMANWVRSLKEGSAEV